jgi:cold shock protein
MATHTESDELAIGVVKVYFPLKGFGFITREKGKDVFFFRKDALDESALIEGNSVQFKLQIGAKGPCATQVRRNG